MENTMMSPPEHSTEGVPQPMAVEMRNIWKRFPGVIANQGVNFDLQPGEVHALLGENGAGKSTLMNILSGIYRQDEGDILVKDQVQNFRSPAQAITGGIGMVHQHFRLVEKMTVAENIHLGWGETPWHSLKTKIGERTEEICNNLGYHVDPHARIWQLSVGEQQRVEILRVLARGAQVLILDEPTAVLTPIEAEELFRVIEQLAASGHTVVFISHKLDEVLAVSDRVTVLRHGQKIDTRPTSECDQRILANLMVGQSVVFHDHRKEGEKGAPIMEVRQVNARNDRGLPALVNVELTVNQREIVGVAGVAGNGQRELAETLTGLRPVESGSILIDGSDFTGLKPTEFAGAGVGHIPEDRIGVGLVPGKSVTHNAILRKYASPPIRQGLRIDKGEAQRYGEHLVERADVRVASTQTKVSTLSGGNQQRLLTGREIEIASRLLVAVHPTRGLDVAATEAVRSVLVEYRNEGNAVLLISEDLDELIAVSDRIVVMYQGQIVGDIPAEEIDREEIGLLMGGITTTEEGAA
jgi:general nucleoside transport system ATP-binding protein